jgi:hypothetical protein
MSCLVLKSSLLFHKERILLCELPVSECAKSMMRSP